MQKTENIWWRWTSARCVYKLLSDVRRKMSYRLSTRRVITYVMFWVCKKALFIVNKREWGRNGKKAKFDSISRELNGCGCWVRWYWFHSRLLEEICVYVCACLWESEWPNRVGEENRGTCSVDSRTPCRHSLNSARIVVEREWHWRRKTCRMQRSARHWHRCVSQH